MLSSDDHEIFVPPNVNMSDAATNSTWGNNSDTLKCSENCFLTKRILTEQNNRTQALTMVIWCSRESPGWGISGAWIHRVASATRWGRGWTMLAHANLVPIAWCRRQTLTASPEYHVMPRAEIAPTRTITITHTRARDRSEMDLTTQGIWNG